MGTPFFFFFFDGGACAPVMIKGSKRPRKWHLWLFVIMYEWKLLCKITSDSDVTLLWKKQSHILELLILMNNKKN